MPDGRIILQCPIRQREFDGKLVGCFSYPRHVLKLIRSRPPTMELLVPRKFDWSERPESAY